MHYFIQSFYLARVGQAALSLPCHVCTLRFFCLKAEQIGAGWYPNPGGWWGVQVYQTFELILSKGKKDEKIGFNSSFYDGDYISYSVLCDQIRYLGNRNEYQ
jgi:hypothetical protein